MAKYHCWPKYVAIYYYFGTNWQSNIFLELEFGTLLEFQELEFY